ncbi:hypothetical protein EOM89_03460 [Candidatus Falkowbacteria bacterium]|nr:hypothetical protein [Candidatus Falkowbacteria bacterium]
MIRMGLLNIIRRMHLRQKLSIREIARLRDVRGDSFFTMTTKMVPYLVARMRAMLPFDCMRGPVSLPSGSS